MAPEGGEKKHILIVDDDESVGCALKRLLSAQGYAVTAADGCATALAAIEQQRFDLYIVDIRLGCCDGYELLGRMNAVSRAPAIAISADAEPCHIARGIDMGFLDYLAKPIQPDRLSQSVRMQLSA